MPIQVFRRPFVWVLQQSFYRQDGENFGGNAFPEFGFRLGGVGFLGGGVVPVQFVVFVEGNLIGVFGGGIDEGALHFACDFGAFEDDAHFGVESGGARVEVE